jgi:hypothetical protein
MAFVPGFDHDVFISYAHVDNQPLSFGGKDLRWVTCLKQQLEKLVDQQLGRTAATKIWMDLEDLGGNDSVTPTLEGAIRKTATLVVVLSNGYISSNWCQKEIREFANSARSDGRLFVIHLSDIPLENRPEQIRDLSGFNFFDNELKAELDPERPEYRRELLGLRTRLARKLAEMQETFQPQAQEEVVVSSTPAVLLAEVTPDLEYEREALRIYVERLGYRVLPAKYYRRGAQEFQEMLDQDLAESSLFVQLLGQFISPQTDDYPEGYEGMQLRQAKLAEVPLLRSYGRDTVNFERITNEFHRSLLEASDVMALDLEEFKVEIKRKLDELALRARLSDGRELGDKRVLINALSGDIASAYQLRDRLETMGLPYDILDEEEALEESAKVSDPVGLVLVYGENSCGKWIKQQMRSFRTMRLERQPLDLFCALYFDPPEQRKKLLASPPSFFRTIDSCSGEAEFEQFVHELRAKVATS